MGKTVYNFCGLVCILLRLTGSGPGYASTRRTGYSTPLVGGTGAAQQGVDDARRGGPTIIVFFVVIFGDCWKQILSLERQNSE